MGYRKCEADRVAVDGSPDGTAGTVALLGRDTPAVYARIDELRQQYAREANRRTLLFHGSGPGAAAVGTARV